METDEEIRNWLRKSEFHDFIVVSGIILSLLALGLMKIFDW